MTRDAFLARWRTRQSEWARIGALVRPYHLSRLTSHISRLTVLLDDDRAHHSTREARRVDGATVRVGPHRGEGALKRSRRLCVRERAILEGHVVNGHGAIPGPGHGGVDRHGVDRRLKEVVIHSEAQGAPRLVASWVGIAGRFASRGRAHAGAFQYPGDGRHRSQQTEQAHLFFGESGFYCYCRLALGFPGTGEEPAPSHEAGHVGDGWPPLYSICGR